MKRLLLSVAFVFSFTCAAHAQYGRIAPVTGLGAGTNSYLMSSGVRGYPGPLSYGSRGVTGLGAGTNSYLMSGAGSYYGSAYRSSIGYGYAPRGSYHTPSYGYSHAAPYGGFGYGTYSGYGGFSSGTGWGWGAY